MELTNDQYLASAHEKDFYTCRSKHVRLPSWPWHVGLEHPPEGAADTGGVRAGGEGGHGVTGTENLILATGRVPQSRIRSGPAVGRPNR